MPAVALVECDEYRRDLVLKKLEEAVELIGGIGAFVEPGMKVLVKPNILRASGPDQYICTHPDVLWAVCKLLKDHGCSVTVAESPGAGFVYGPNQLRKAYETTGYADLARDPGVTLNEDVGYQEVPNPTGRAIKRFTLISPALEADAIVVVSKLKTHLFTYMTAATKNCFGLIPGMEKATFHGRLEDPKDFSEMLVDLNELVRPRLQIIDAVIGMEGDGPNSGEPRKIGAILASPSYAAIDVVAARLMGIDPVDVPTVTAALHRGLLHEGFTDVDVQGAKVEDLAVSDFKRPSTYASGKRQESGFLMKNFMRLARTYALRPVVDAHRCTGCGKCVRACPKETIVLHRGKARVKHSDCICCYTCHEMCEVDAIDLKSSMGGRAMRRILERRTRHEGDGR